MLPPVVVDLGPELGRAQLEIVLEACNEAIALGACVPEGSAGDQAPRAIARARAADRQARVVRIEVRLAGEDESASIVRELRFARRDPVSERWRSVGLAIATLVGEGEQRAREEEDAAAVSPAGEPAPAEPVLAEPAAPAPAAEPSEPAARAQAEPTPPSARVETAPPPPPPEPAEDEAPEPEIVFEPAEPEPPLDWSHRPLFIGLGALVGNGFDAGTGRLGGSLRGAWHFEGGLALGASLGYAVGSSDPVSVAWLTFDASVGYRVALSERSSVGAWLFAGAQRTSFEASGSAASPIDAFSPRLGLSGDVWWRVVPMFGLWAALEAATTVRETRVFVAPDREPERSLPISGALSAGVGFWFQ